MDGTIISEIFSSIQGEGIFTGVPTVFVRTAGCNLRCRWCDTPYAQDPRNGSEMSIDEIVEKVSSFGIPIISITGGEPLEQPEDVLELAERLISAGLGPILLETNGSHPIVPFLKKEDVIISVDMKLPSSGMHNAMLMDNYRRLRRQDQIKIVVSDESDWEYALDVLTGLYGENMALPCTLVVQPAWGTDPRWLAEKVLKSGIRGVRFMLQMHKYIWPDEERGR